MPWMAQADVALLRAFNLTALIIGIIAHGDYCDAGSTYVTKALDLTDAQVAAAVQAATDYDEVVQEKIQRIYQLQNEINEAVKQDVPGAVTVGNGYVEIESIRRFMQGELDRMGEKVRGLLTDAQKLKLKTLEDAMKLSVTVAQGQCFGFLVAQLPPGSTDLQFRYRIGAIPNLARQAITFGYGGSSSGGCPSSGWFNTGGFILTGAKEKK